MEATLESQVLDVQEAVHVLAQRPFAQSFSTEDNCKHGTS